MSWMIPAHELDTEQNEFLQRLNVQTSRNWWIQGFAGSGKTVLLVYALQKFKARNPNLRAIIVLYTHSLIDLVRTGLNETVRDVPVVTYFDFTRNHSRENYDAIFVDEVQDLPTHVLQKLTSSCKQLIVAGDVCQSIYDDGAPPDEIERLTRSEPFILKILHRLTHKIVAAASKFVSDKRILAAKRGRLQNVEIEVGRAATANGEIQWVSRLALESAGNALRTAILLPNHKSVLQFCQSVLEVNGKPKWREVKNERGKTDYDSLNQHFASHGLRMQYLGNKFGSLSRSFDRNLVNIMTYHSSKGLDFHSVFLPLLHSRQTIWRDDEERAQTLFFVALTRTFKHLRVSYSGEPHEYVTRIPADCVKRVDINALDTPAGSENDDSFFF